MASELCNAHNAPSVAWCNLNEEGNRLAREIRGAVEVSGNDPEERKEETFSAFVRGDVRVLVTKPSIGGFGLNLQHCAHQTYFPSHSYEQYYQSVRRCWRFGQKKPVRLDVVATDGEVRVLDNMRSKARKMDLMFEALVREMSRSTRIERENLYVNEMRKPQWL